MKAQPNSCDETLDRNFFADRKLVPVGRQPQDSANGQLMIPQCSFFFLYELPAAETPPLPTVNPVPKP